MSTATRLLCSARCCGSALIDLFGRLLGRRVASGCGLLATLALSAATTGAWAQTAPNAAPRIGGTPPAPCVAVDIAGHRAGQLDCATQALDAAARRARRDAVAAHAHAVTQAGAPAVQVGVASRSAARLRLRENFGVLVRPPSMPAPVHTNPMGRRP